MNLKFKCLILDHDETAVKSTRELHYPSFLKTLDAIRPDIQMSYDEFYLHCFDPGFGHLLTEKLKLGEEELKDQYQQWKNDTKHLVPEFYKGLIDLLKIFKNLGGIVVVASHNEVHQIKKHYELKAGFVPEIIFGWDFDPEKRKPAPYPVKEVIRRYGISKKDILIVDDLKPGLEMAKTAHVKFAYAGWSTDLKIIENYMKKEADYFLKTIDELQRLVIQ